MNMDEQLNLHIEELRNLPLDDSIVSYLTDHKGKEYFLELLKCALDDFLDVIQRCFIKYDEKILKTTPEILIYKKLTSFIKNDSLAYYSAVASFFENDHEKTMYYLKTANATGFFGKEDKPLTHEEFANCFIAPFKAGFPGFWMEIKNMLSETQLEKGCRELSEAVELFYFSDDANAIRSALEKTLQVAPNSNIAKEMLALNYYEDGLWGNTVALLEQIDGPILIFDVYMYFIMGVCYGKLHETKNEVKAYEKSAAVYDGYPFVLNNLGYTYYKIKQYNKALECFKRCLDNGWEIKYAANNYVRTLLAMERFKDAKDFVKSSPTKIYKDLLERVNYSENTNRRKSADISLDVQFELDAREALNKNVDLGVKKQQFTSEKILEDEIVLRMERGLPVFGMNLKIYRRNGIYGRQYILSNGKRLDVLAEDDIGNLYIIELKKDSGYDDAYQQTLEYLEWFDANWTEKTKNIYGIICLNDPSEELINKVHKNSRMRVFEYQISYTER